MHEKYINKTHRWKLHQEKKQRSMVSDKMRNGEFHSLNS
jgi:pantothenate kinase-related protein Tda10